MKKLLTFLIFTATFSSIAQVGIGTTNPDVSSILDVKSTSKGFLPPRMTQSNRDGIATPANGLLIYCTDCDSGAGCLQVNNGTTALPAWECIGGVAAPTFSVSAVCNGFVTGTYMKNSSIAGTYTVKISNDSFSTATIAIGSADLVLSDIATASPALTVGTPTASPVAISAGTITLNSGASTIVTYPITGTPTATGTLKGTWSKLSLSCSKTVNVINGTATFSLPRSENVISVKDGTPLVDMQGVVDNASNKITIKVPYTSGSGSYDAYTSSVVAGSTGEGGDSNGFSFSYPAGTFGSSGTILVTITVDGDGSYNAKKLLFGGKENIVTIPFMFNGSNVGNIILNVTGGILDKMYGIADNTGDANSHKFVYFPVTGADGKTWLNNNLGAHYAKNGHASFNPTKQATGKNDFLAFGSFFQWGRKPDGHELITWTGGTTATPVNNTTNATATNTPTHASFITTAGDWRSTSDESLWKTEWGTNNPCPEGYRLPTIVEWANFSTAISATSITEAYNSTLKLTQPGQRQNGDGAFANQSNLGHYMSATTTGVGGDQKYRFFWTTTGESNWRKGMGFTVRCIKDY